MKMGETIPVQGGAAAVLLCARCKQAVKQGDNHVCQQEEVLNDESNEARQNSSKA